MFPTMNTTNDNECFVPINFRRLILAYKKKFSPVEATISDIHPVYIIKKIK